MEYIDIDNWQRKEQFYFYKDFDMPYFNLCADVEISNLLTACKRHDISTFSAIVFLISKISNDIDAFRMRIRDDQVVLHSAVHPSFTVLNDKQKLSFCDVTFDPDPHRFLAKAKTEIDNANQTPELNANKDPDESLFMSCIPWVKFSSISHAMRLNPCDSVPRFAWGKYEEQENSTIMPLSVQVHHALVDGLHVGEFYQKMEQALENADQIFSPE